MKLITEKLHLGTLCLLVLLFLGNQSTLIAQETAKESKKVVIITKKKDKDGKETVEKIVREGTEIDEEEIDKLIEQAKKEGGEIDIQIEKEEQKMSKGKQGKSGKKVIITTKKTDAAGNETIDEMVREGDTIDEAEIDKLIEEAKKKGGEVEVRIEKTERKVIKKSKDGQTENIWIEKDGEAINLEELEGEGVMIFKTDDGKVIKLDGDKLHKEHMVIEKDGAAEKGMTKVVTVTVDEDGNTTTVEKNIPKKQREEMEVTVTVDEDGNTKIIKKRKKVADVEAKLEKMGIKLPVLGEPVANYVHAVTSNNWVFLAGKGPRKDDGKNIVGKLGKDLTVEQGYEAARWAGINLLAALKGEIGDLNRVVRIVKVKGMVNAVPEFTDHSKVINGFSDLIVEVFGDKGKHARAAVGMSSLPGNMAVEIEVVVEIE